MDGDKLVYFAPFRLTHQGQAAVQICIPRAASAAVLAAAEDLQAHVLRISGVTLPICTEADALLHPHSIHVGYTQRAADLGLPAPEPVGERVLLQYNEHTDGDLFAYGNDHISADGTANAVTMLLEKLGCGWFGIDPLWQIVPEKKDLQINYLAKDHKPRYSSRRNWVLRTNPELGRRWYLGGEWKYIEHAYWVLFPREKYLKEHPQWYALVNGKRDPYSVEWWQMCYSNKELQEVTAQKIREFFCEHPEYTQAALSANDGWFEGFCECEECQKMGTPSEIILKFVNRVAELIEDEFPDKRLMFFVYFPTWDAPRTPIKAHKNVTLMFCKESPMCASVDDGPDNGYHVRYHYQLGHETYPVNWKENAKLWIERTQCQHVCFWEWNCCAAAYPIWKDIPWVQGELMGRNLRCFDELDGEYVYFDQGPVAPYNDTEESYPLRWPLWYLSAKSCWDGHETPSQLLQEACGKLFEAAGDMMFAYYSCLAELNGKCEAKGIAWHMPEPWEVYPPACFARVDAILDAASRMKPEMSPKAVLRLENQIALWEKAKQVILENMP